MRLEDIMEILSPSKGDDPVTLQRSGDQAAVMLLLAQDVDIRHIAESLMSGAIIATLCQRNPTASIESILSSLDDVWMLAKLNVIETLHAAFHALEERRDAAADKPELLAKLPKTGELLCSTYFGAAYSKHFNTNPMPPLTHAEILSAEVPLHAKATARKNEILAAHAAKENSPSVH